MKKNKIIWIVNQFANTPDMPGGTRHFEIASFLAKKGFKVEIFASDFNLSKRKSLKLKNAKLFSVEKIKGIKIHWLKTISYRKNDWKRYLNLLSFCFNEVFSGQLPKVQIDFACGLEFRSGWWVLGFRFFSSSFSPIVIPQGCFVRGMTARSSAISIFLPPP